MLFYWGRATDKLYFLKELLSSNIQMIRRNVDSPSTPLLPFFSSLHLLTSSPAVPKLQFWWKVSDLGEAVLVSGMCTPYYTSNITKGSQAFTAPFLLWQWKIIFLDKRSSVSFETNSLREGHSPLAGMSVGWLLGFSCHFGVCTASPPDKSSLLFSLSQTVAAPQLVWLSEERKDFRIYQQEGYCSYKQNITAGLWRVGVIF